MKKNLLASFLILGTGLLLSACTKGAPAASSATPSPTPQAATSKTIKGTLQNLLAGGSAQQCTFSNTTPDTTVNGTVLLAKGKMKGDITTVTPKMTIVSHMIMEQPTMYIWSDQSKQGMKMNVPSATPNASPLSTPTTANGAPNLNQEYSYDCNNWVEDDAAFALPADITFMELGVTPPTASGAKAPAGASAQCAACNSVPAGAGRTACLTQLHCQ